MAKQRILITYIPMIVGGSTTSLLNLLHEIDYSKYTVELLLYKNQGELLSEIPEQVCLLKQAWKDRGRFSELIYKILHPQILKSFFVSRLKAKKEKNSQLKNQLMWPVLAKYARKENTEYDVAIAFLEGWPTYYTAKYVKAKKKIAWFHPDYPKTGFLMKYDEPIFNTFDTIVTVSTACCEHLRSLLPEKKENIVVVENILSKKLLLRKAQENIESDVLKTGEKIRLISVCRLDIASKGLDRGIKALSELRNQKNIDKYVWYILGEGKDRGYIETLICELHMQDRIFLMGEKLNPFPYVIQADAFFLPSRFEGKPMAVTEAMMVGCPPVVTEYASASEQIRNKVNGLIINNRDDMIVEALELLEKSDLEKWKRYLNENPIDSMNSINEIYELMKT